MKNGFQSTEPIDENGRYDKASTYLQPVLNSVSFNISETDLLIRAHLPDVELLVLFGSRVKARATSRSDWDIGVVVAPNTYEGMQQFMLQAEIAQVLALPFDDVDLVDLRYCSPLLAFALASEGQLLYEYKPATYHRFQVRAFKRYADTAKFRRAREAYLGFDNSFSDRLNRRNPGSP